MRQNACFVNSPNPTQRYGTVGGIAWENYYGGAGLIQGFLRDPVERTKGALVLCPCPGADLARSGEGIELGP